MIKKTISQLLAVLFLAISISAQSETRNFEPFDELGKLNSEEIMARLDSLIYYSSKNPSTKALIIVYGGSENCFLCHYKHGSFVDAYLKNTRKFLTDKYIIEYCYDKTEDLRTQLYLLPAVSKRAKCEETLEAPKNSALFDSVSFYTSNKISPLENALIEIGIAAGGEYSVSALRKAKEILDKSPESKIYVIAYLGTNLESG